MRLKRGVIVDGVKGEIVAAMMVCAQIYRDEDVEFVVTSLCDGDHSRNSKHYLGYAVDIRSRLLPNPMNTAEMIQASLGRDFFVLVEDDHIHIQFNGRRGA